MMQSLKKTIEIFWLLSLVLVVSMLDAAFASDSKKNSLINCDIQNQPCTQSISGGSVTFDIGTKPVKAMTDLTFEVKVDGLKPAKPPVINLKMPGMKMGPNQVDMKMTANGVYKGTGIIVRCPSGKTIWQAVVNLPGIGNVDFIFDVIY